MMKLSAILLFALMFIGCSWHVQEYQSLQNVDIYIGGRANPEGAERDAQSFEDQVNKQFDSNMKMPRAPFHIGRYIDSWCHKGGIWIVRAEGEF